MARRTAIAASGNGEVDPYVALEDIAASWSECNAIQVLIWAQTSADVERLVKEVERHIVATLRFANRPETLYVG